MSLDIEAARFGGGPASGKVSLDGDRLEDRKFPSTLQRPRLPAGLDPQQHRIIATHWFGLLLEEMA
jgi:hypothetical protein